MKKSIFKITTIFFLTFALLTSFEQEAKAQQTWTYAMVMNGLTYKIHFAQQSGTLTIQTYHSDKNKWYYCTILVSNPEQRYYKVKSAFNGETFEFWISADGKTLTTKQQSTGTVLTYWKE